MERLEVSLWEPPRRLVMPTEASSAARERGRSTPRLRDAIHVYRSFMRWLMRAALADLVDHVARA